MHLVKIHKIEYHPSSKGYILVLKKDKSDIKIPILIGSNEAQTLSLAYEDIRLPRPTTHDLMINIVNELDAKIKHVIIKKYENGTPKTSTNKQLLYKLPPSKKLEISGDALIS